MSGGHVAAVTLVAAGTVVIVAACLGALLAPDVYSRLHYATPISSLGGPLLGTGLSVGSGLNFTTASILMPTILLFVSGPILSAAIGRCATQAERNSSSDSTE